AGVRQGPAGGGRVREGRRRGDAAEVPAAAVGIAPAGGVARYPRAELYVPGMASDGALADRLRELEKLHASLHAMTATLDLGELVRTVLETIKSVTTPEALSLLLFDPERDELVFAASETLCERTLVGRPVAA